MLRCSGLGHRLRANSFLSAGKRRSQSRDNDCPQPEIIKTGNLYLLTRGDTLLRIWAIVREDRKLICYDEPERSLLVASVSLEDRYVLIGRGIDVEKEIFFPLYIVEKEQLEECFFAETLADQREWLEAMTSAANLDQSLSLEGLNLECGKAKRPEKQKKNRESNYSYFSENAPPLSALRDLEESNRQTALRRATLLKQRMISTELKVDELKKLHPEPIYEIPANKLYYQTKLDELNIKLDNYTEAFHRYHEQRRNSMSDSTRHSTGVKSFRKDENASATVETSEGSKCKNALRLFGNFLDTKLRGHKRAKSADIKSHEYLDHCKPRSVSAANADYQSLGNIHLLEASLQKDKILRTEVDASALQEIEAFEKFIKDYFASHNKEFFF